MKLTGKLTAQEVKQARRIVWAPRYYLCLFNNYTWSRFFPIMGAIIAGSILTSWIAQEFQINPLVVGFLIVSIGVACFICLLIRWHQLPQIALNKISNGCPEIIEIDNEGLRMTQADGVSTSMPWNVVKGWRCGSQVIVVGFVKDTNLLPIPLERLEADDRDTIRTMLKLHLGDPTFILSEERYIGVSHVDQFLAVGRNL